MFSDLNRYAIRPTKSINILYNSWEEDSIIAKIVVDSVPAFKDLTEKERTAISNRSKALFTLSAICNATSELLNSCGESFDEKVAIAVQFWNEVDRHIPEWSRVRNGELKSSVLRQNYICSLSITLVAIGASGCALLKQFPNSWSDKLKRLDQIDWRKKNSLWEGLVFVNGRVAANRATQKAMTQFMINFIMKENGV